MLEKSIPQKNDGGEGWKRPTPANKRPYPRKMMEGKAGKGQHQPTKGHTPEKDGGEGWKRPNGLVPQEEFIDRLQPEN